MVKTRTKTRQIEGSWLSTFMEWTLPRSEAPESMIRWAGLFALANVAKRKVYFPRRLLGGYEIFPNLYVVYVGKPGVVRKSTTAKFAEDVLHSVSSLLEMESIVFAANATSASKLLDALSKSPDSTIAIISGEFSDLISATPEDMYELLTSIFDNHRSFKHDTWSHGEKSIEKPVVNLLAATTPAWLSGQPTEFFAGGGFASRVIFIYESKRRQSRMYYDEVVDWNEITCLGKQLENDLSVISKVTGEMTHDTKRTKKWVEDWYQTFSEKDGGDTDDIRIQGYNQRKPLHVHKVAMLLSLAERDDKVVTLDHFRTAIKYLEEIEEKMPRALANVGTNPLASKMDEIVDFIRARDGATKKQISMRFYRDLSVEKINESLVALEIMGEVKSSGQGKGMKFMVKH